MRTFRVTYRTIATADVEIDDKDVYDDGTPDIDALYAAMEYVAGFDPYDVSIIDYRSVDE